MKKFFRTVMAFCLAGGMLAFTGCTDYEDDINKLDDRLTAVEGTLADLQKKITDGAVITDVEKTSNGVTVTLSDDSKFELTNGTNGTNGSIVTIGPDGYWYIDDVKTDYPATGPKGDDGATGNDGKPGADANVVYYVPNEDGFWYKVTETQDGEPIGEPVNTQISWVASADGVTAVWDEENGALLLSGVEGVDGTFAIPLYSALKSLAFVPEVLHDGLGVIDFYSIYDLKGAFAATNNPEVTYRVNPANADLTDVEWAFINRDVETKVAGDETTLIEIVGEPEAGENGGVIVTVTAKDNKKLPSDFTGKQVIVALQAMLEGEEIVSDYSFVQRTDLKDFNIINKEKYTAAKPEVIKFKEGTGSDNKADYPTLAAKADLMMNYQETLDINKYLETYANEVKKSLPEIAVAPDYKISLVKEYLGDDNKTNQQEFVVLSEDGVLSINDSFISNPRPAIGRTPLLYVQSEVNGKVVADCYIKVQIVDDTYSPDPKGEKVFKTITGTYRYNEIDPTDGEYLVLEWKDANSEIFADLGMSYDDFVRKYDVNNPEIHYDVDKDGNYDEPIVDAKPAGVEPDATGMSVSTATNAVELNISNMVDENSSACVKVVIPAKDNNQDVDVAIVFEYSVSHTPEFPALNPDYLKPGTTNTVQVKGKLNADESAWVMQSSIREHFENYLAGWETPDNHSGDYWAVLQPLEADGTPVPYLETSPTAKPQTGVEITDGTPGWEEAEIALTAPLTKESFTAVVTIVVQLSNGHFCEMHYNVEFLSPFVMNLDEITLKTLTAEHSTADMNDYITIEDRDGKAIYEKGALTKYAQDTYKLNNVNFSYDLVFGGTDYPGFDDEASFSKDGDKTLNIINTSDVDWYNKGTILQQQKYAGYKVEMEITNICKIAKVGNITILTSADSIE